MVYFGWIFVGEGVVVVVGLVVVGVDDDFVVGEFGIVYWFVEYEFVGWVY